MEQGGAIGGLLPWFHAAFLLDWLNAVCTHVQTLSQSMRGG